jgi:hypothetical protein
VSALPWRSPANLRGETSSHVVPGDLVRTGENFHPHYCVVAVSEDRAWIRDTQYGSDHIVPVDRCRRI